ncbi:hypothetical protein [Methylobacter sp. BlB1]|uniref:hypothetical protein n=1 Tax=Methylobacter sp. BlB1 TaxID=2785914 RepID=UPI0018933266|nr:hypothetical protein [Methylobacter sp. BlB1]MBF6649037.1 hypothetical protein [Methylobacter sp. BlB1]
MFAHGFKWHFIRGLSVLLVALCLPLTVSYGQGEELVEPPPTPSANQDGTSWPSAEQARVAESTFAVQLAEALKLGPISSGTNAEELLSNLGIKPSNGWVSERPITPVALNDIEKGISAASDQKKIALKKDQALKLFGDIKAKLGLNVNPSLETLVDQTPGNRVIYRYTDAEGVIHFTDVYDSIPEEYRKNVTKNSE